MIRAKPCKSAGGEDSVRRFATPLLFAAIVLVTLFGPWTSLHDWLRGHCASAIVAALIYCGPAE